MLSKQAWDHTASVREAIQKHPFNQELMDGTLSQVVFAYYIEQDAVFLPCLAQAFAHIASRVPITHARTFLSLSDYAFVEEQKVIHDFYRKTFAFKETGGTAPATLFFTSFLLRCSAVEPVEIGIAAILPCLWIYKEVGLFITQHTNPDNPYTRWIEAYACDDFGRSVDNLIAVFDNVADQATPGVRKKMLETFYQSAVLEWRFWNDAYHKKVFDDLTI